MLQELDCLKILITAVHIRYPFAVILSVVKIQHGSYGIHTDSISMINILPKQRIRDQEVRYFRTAVIVNQRSPMRMRTLTRIEVFI